MKKIVIITLFASILFFSVCIFISSPYRELRPYSIFGGKAGNSEKTFFINKNRVIYIAGNGTTPDFFIDQIPTTIVSYKKCVLSDQCQTHHYRDNYANIYKSPLYNMMPVSFVTFNEARTYCQAYGGDLPTADQWLLASGNSEYAWGDQMPTLSRANIDGFYQWQTPAGWLPDGASWSGVLDLNGNVREWILDENPDNPSEKGLKGGGFQDSFSSSDNEYTFYHEPTSSGFNRGFRCVYPADIVIGK